MDRKPTPISVAEHVFEQVSQHIPIGVTQKYSGRWQILVARDGSDTSDVIIECDDLKNWLSSGNRISWRS